MEMQTQFSQSMLTDQQRAAPLLERHAVGLPNPSQALANQFSYDPQKPQSRGSSYDYYQYGRSLIREAGEKPDWQQTMTGRILTRMVTRGVFGALAFTWAGNYAQRSLKNYTPESIQTFGEWRKALLNPKTNPLAASETSVNHLVNTPNTMQAIAKAFDVVAGKPIQYASRALAPAGAKEEWFVKSVHFRPRAMVNDIIAKPRADGPWRGMTYGRSLGHEVVAITTDFAAASFADASMRYVAQAIDPNIEKDREKDSKAAFDWYRKGSFSIAAFGKDTAKKLWQVVSFNQGEDWAVAVPYAYFMKWHRNVLDKFSPGFKYASDHATMNGAVAKAKADINPATGKIDSIRHVGDFQAEGAWDLQARFTVYNVLTLMYREGYKAVGASVSKWWNAPSLVPSVSLPDNPLTSAVEGIGNAVRYVTKSFIKANLYMQPAVPFFWMFRVPQSAWRGGSLLVNDAHNPAEALPAGSSRMLTTDVNTPAAVHDGLLKRDFGLPNNQQFVKGIFANAEKPKGAQHIDDYYKFLKPGYSRNDPSKILSYRNKVGAGDAIYSGSHKVSNHPYGNYNPFENKHSGSLFSAALKPFGRLSFNTGESLFDKVSGVSEKSQKRMHRLLGIAYDENPQAMQANRVNLRNAVHTAVDASFAYTPYMIAKAETARRWDNKDMDSAIYRLMDGVVSLDLKETKSALKDIGSILTNPPPTVEDPGFLQNKREETAPSTKVSAATVSRAALMHPEHRTLQ